MVYLLALHQNSPYVQLFLVYTINLMTPYFSSWTLTVQCGNICPVRPNFARLIPSRIPTNATALSGDRVQPVKEQQVPIRHDDVNMITLETLPARRNHSRRRPGWSAGLWRAKTSASYSLLLIDADCHSKSTMMPCSFRSQSISIQHSCGIQGLHQRSGMAWWRG